MGQSIQEWTKAVFHKFYLVHSWILCPKYSVGKYLKANKKVSKVDKTNTKDIWPTSKEAFLALSLFS